jgi:predicted nucleotidyltransferase
MPPSADRVLTELASHRAELRALGVRRLGLFGSTARGEARPDSDLDFVVEFDEFSFNRYGGIVELLEELFKCPVDVAPLDDLRPAYRPSILPEIRYAALD